MITIPEIAKTLEELREALNVLDAEKKKVESDLYELRAQLGLERMPGTASDQSETPLNARTPRRF